MDVIILNDGESVQLLATVDEASTGHWIVLQPLFYIFIIFFGQLEEEDVLRASHHQDFVPEHEHVTQVIFGDSVEVEDRCVLRVDLDGASLPVEAVNDVRSLIIEASLWEVFLCAIFVVICL